MLRKHQATWGLKSFSTLPSTSKVGVLQHCKKKLAGLEKVCCATFTCTLPGWAWFCSMYSWSLKTRPIKNGWSSIFGLARSIKHSGFYCQSKLVLYGPSHWGHFQRLFTAISFQGIFLKSFFFLYFCHAMPFLLYHNRIFIGQKCSSFHLGLDRHDISLCVLKPLVYIP